LYDPLSGRVLVDGHDLKTLNLVDYHHQVGPVLQDTFLFQGSLRDNMEFAMLHATEEEILEALERAEVMDFVRQLPEGLDTDLSEGTRVSGGQKQRIGIARAILRDPAMIILDEPTSALDIPTERAIVKTLEKVIENRTTFFVSHRLALVSGCEVIMVMDEGRLVGRGTHRELLKTCELYAGLWAEQYGDGESVEAAGESDIAREDGEQAL
jgi:ABC-type multidrug transport system fused ATPase/permease subunit